MNKKKAIDKIGQLSKEDIGHNADLYIANQEGNTQN